MADIYIRMLKTAVGPNFGPLLAGCDYRVSRDEYERLRAGFACRQIRDTDDVRKRAKPMPKVAGGGDQLLEKSRKAEDMFIDAPLPAEPPPSAGIIQPEIESVKAKGVPLLDP